MLFLNCIVLSAQVENLIDCAGVELENIGQVKNTKDYKTRRKDLLVRNIVDAGIGLEYEMQHNLAAGVKAECLLGADWQILNLAAGYRLMFYNFGCSRVLQRDYVSWMLNSFYADARINLNRYGLCRFHLDGEYAYNLRGKSTSRYNVGLDAVSDENLCRNFGSLAAKAGARIGKWDIAAYFRYDLKPAVDQQYIYENRAYDYYAFVKAVNERWRVGLSVTYYIYE